MFRRSIALGCAFFAILVPLMAQDAPPASVDLELQFETLEQTTIDIRELEALEPVTRGFPTRDEVRAYIEESLALSLTDENLAELNAFYVAFDFLPRGTDLREVFNELYGQQVAGYYDPETKEMNVVSFAKQSNQRLGLLDQIIYVHEYTHALQDQHFDLNDYLDTIEDTENSDLALAYVSLVEGDATFVMNDYAAVEAQKNPLGALLDLATAGLQAGNLSLPAGTPKIIGDELLFPYLSGEQFVRAIIAQGGITALNAAYSQPPVSTEQILHPEKYLQGEKPLPLTLEPAPLDETWTVATEGIMGEFYLRSYLDTQLATADAEKAAAGWGNGAYVIYEQDGTTAWTLSLVWDSEAEQAEFATFYDEFAQARIGGTANEGCYTGGSDTVAVVDVLCIQSDEDSTLITYGPTEDAARALLASTSKR